VGQRYAQNISRPSRGTVKIFGPTYQNCEQGLARNPSADKPVRLIATKDHRNPRSFGRKIRMSKNGWVSTDRKVPGRASSRAGEIRGRARPARRPIRANVDNHQRYSIENQAAAIAAYAARYNLNIVRTYRDEGLSGLKIDKREGLKQLITDVCSGRADFSRVLVYDVSRWGRFQDVDESAHYEFLCRQAGIMVEYCAEQFDNDGSLMSSIVKNIKRVMAAEYSRELSVKVHAGQLRLAALGFRQGGPLSYGLRRELIDENRFSKGYLKRGQQKSLKTDHVVLRLGAENEIEVIRRIFREYVEDRKSEEEIVRRLNGGGADRAGFSLEGVLKNDCRNPQGALRDSCVFAQVPRNVEMPL
jgi:DNA invertase Pin-like site-specific DNA recombinase